jgi:hypothetical protein
VKPPDSTKQLARLRLEANDQAGWTAIVSVVGQADERSAWPRSAEAAWWKALRERLRVGIVGHRGAKT